MPGTPATTPRHQAPRYGDLDAADIGAIANSISDRFDVTAPIFQSGLASARPSTGAGIADRYYYATDTGELSRDAGGASPTWTVLNPRSRTLVSSLPGTPYDGQEILYLADASRPAIWPLRWRAASPNAQKWEPIGECAPLYQRVAATVTTTSTTAAALTGGPSVVLPFAGVYEIEFGYNGRPSAAGAFAAANLFVGGADTGDYVEVTADSSGGGMPESISAHASTEVSPASASATAEMRYRSSVGTSTATFGRRYIKARPVRVG